MCVCVNVHIHARKRTCAKVHMHILSVGAFTGCVVRGLLHMAVDSTLGATFSTVFVCMCRISLAYFGSGYARLVQNLK